MGLLLRIMLLVAGFAYAAMPLQGGAAAAWMPASGPAMVEAASADLPHGATTLASPCPHAELPSGTDHPGHKTVAFGHCGACLTLPPMIHFADLRLAPGTAQAPGLAPRLKSAPAMPLERPPRIRG